MQEQVHNKVIHLLKYTKSNILNLKLEKYREKIESTFEQELLFFNNKIDEEVMNFNLWVERLSAMVKESFQ